MYVQGTEVRHWCGKRQNVPRGDFNQSQCSISSSYKIWLLFERVIMQIIKKHSIFGCSPEACQSVWGIENHHRILWTICQPYEVGTPPVQARLTGRISHAWPTMWSRKIESDILGTETLKVWMLFPILCERFLGEFTNSDMEWPSPLASHSQLIGHNK